MLMTPLSSIAALQNMLPTTLALTGTALSRCKVTNAIMRI